MTSSSRKYNIASERHRGRQTNRHKQTEADTDTERAASVLVYLMVEHGCDQERRVSYCCVRHTSLASVSEAWAPCVSTALMSAAAAVAIQLLRPAASSADVRDSTPSSRQAAGEVAGEQHRHKACACVCTVEAEAMSVIGHGGDQSSEMRPKQRHSDTKGSPKSPFHVL